MNRTAYRTALSVALSIAASLAGHATAQPTAVDQFPAAATSFLGAELPQMEAAIAARDRDYFEAAMGRTLEFSDSWGFKTRANPALAPYASCTEAVGDFTIVGLCRLMPKGEVCEPGLAPRFDANVKRCRDLAAKP